MMPTTSRAKYFCKTLIKWTATTRFFKLFIFIALMTTVTTLKFLYAIFAKRIKANFAKISYNAKRRFFVQTLGGRFEKCCLERLFSHRETFSKAGAWSGTGTWVKTAPYYLLMQTITGRWGNRVTRILSDDYICVPIFSSNIIKILKVKPLGMYEGSDTPKANIMT